MVGPIGLQTYSPDKARIERAKKDKKKAMVIKRINKRGIVSVYPGCIFEAHAKASSCMVIWIKNWPVTMFKTLVDQHKWCEQMDGSGVGCVIMSDAMTKI